MLERTVTRRATTPQLVQIMRQLRASALNTSNTSNTSNPTSTSNMASSSSALTGIAAVPQDSMPISPRPVSPPILPSTMPVPSTPNTSDNPNMPNNIATNVSGNSSTSGSAMKTMPPSPITMPPSPSSVGGFVPPSPPPTNPIGLTYSPPNIHPNGGNMFRSGNVSSDRDRERAYSNSSIGSSSAGSSGKVGGIGYTSVPVLPLPGNTTSTTSTGNTGVPTTEREKESEEDYDLVDDLIVTKSGGLRERGNSGSSGSHSFHNTFPPQPTPSNANNNRLQGAYSVSSNNGAPSSMYGALQQQLGGGGGVGSMSVGSAPSSGGMGPLARVGGGHSRGPSPPSTGIGSTGSMGLSIQEQDALQYSERIGECIQSLISCSDRCMDHTNVHMLLTMLTERQGKEKGSEGGGEIVIGRDSEMLLINQPKIPINIMKSVIEPFDNILLSIKIHVIILSFLKIHLDEFEKKSNAANGYPTQPTMQFFLRVS